MKRKEVGRRWELASKIVIIPTVVEIMKKEGLSWEEAAKRGIIICGNAHIKGGTDCFRKLNGHTLCDGCPKYSETKKPKAFFEWEIQSAKVW